MDESYCLSALRSPFYPLPAPGSLPPLHPSAMHLHLSGVRYPPELSHSSLSALQSERISSLAAERYGVLGGWMGRSRGCWQSTRGGFWGALGMLAGDWGFGSAQRVLAGAQELLGGFSGGSGVFQGVLTGIQG